MKEEILLEIRALANILQIRNPISIELKSARRMYNRLRDLYKEHRSEFTGEMIDECKRLAAELERKSKQPRRNRRNQSAKKRTNRNQDKEFVTVRIVQGGSPGLNKRKR